MKHLKFFENINPVIGDFVIIKLNNNRKRGMNNIKIYNMIIFLESNIGKIVDRYTGFVFDVKFEIDDYIRRFKLDEIYITLKIKKS